MASGGFDGRNRSTCGALAQHFLNRLCLRQVVVLCAGAVGVDVVNLILRNVRVLQRGAHHRFEARAFFVRRCQVVRVVVHGPAEYFSIHFGVAALRFFPGFENQHRCAFTENGAVPVHVERPAQVRRNGAQNRKSGQRRQAEPIMAAAEYSAHAAGSQPVDT